MSNPNDYQDKISKIKMIVFDIDGVLTDGRVYIDENGRESKSFALREIDAVNFLKSLGYKIAAITGENTPIVACFQRKISWDHFYSGCKDKVNMLHKIELCEGLSSDELCYIGDGKYDIPALQYAGLGLCPMDASRDAKEVADVLLNGRGGVDCIQELERLMLENRKKG